MTRWLDRLNLSPMERRLVLVGLVIAALLLNYWLIWPMFGEWATTNTELDKQEKRFSTFSAEVGRKAAYERQISDLRKSGAADVLPEDQANRFQQTVYTQASISGVTITQLVPVSSSRLITGSNVRTNQFFDEQQVNVDINCNEEQLVNFLYALGSGDSMIRVREVQNLRLDPSQTKLVAKLTLVASFQKKAPPAPARPSPAAAASAVKPASPPPVQPKGPNSASPTNKAGTNKPASKR